MSTDESAQERRATAAGCQVSELVRDAVYLIEHGMTYGEYVAKHRRNALGLSVPVGSQWRSDDGTDGGRA